MARENFSNALLSIGRDLGAFSDRKAAEEAKQIEYMRQQSLMQLENNLTMGRQNAAERFQAGESSLDRALTRETTAAQGDLTAERYRRDDISSARDAHRRELAAIDDRIQSLRDDLNKEAYFPGSPGFDQAVAELDQLQNQRYQSEAAFMIQMRDLGAAGYKESIDRLLTPGQNESDLLTPPPGPARPGASPDEAAAVGAPEAPAPGPSYGSMGRKPVRRRGTGPVMGPEEPTAARGGLPDFMTQPGQGAAPNNREAVLSSPTTAAAVPSPAPQTTKLRSAGDTMVRQAAIRVSQAMRSGQPPARPDLEALAQTDDATLASFNFTPQQIQSIRTSVNPQPGATPAMPPMGTPNVGTDFNLFGP